MHIFMNTFGKRSIKITYKTLTDTVATNSKTLSNFPTN